MAVTTTKTNKPLNPRGNDQSPKGYNRAELYTGKALDFDGTNDYIDLDGFTLSGTTATISFYYKTDSNKAYAYIFDNTQRWVIGQANTADSFGFYDGSTWRKSTQTLTIGEYYHITAVIEGGNVEFLWNGQSVGDTFTGANSISWASLTEFKLGWTYDATGLGQVDGQIAGFKIFNTALTAAQVADLYNNPEKIVPTGVANSALKLWLPMQEGAGTTAYNGAPDALGSELVTNGNFETNSDWTLASGSTISGGSLNIVSAPYNANTRQTISLTSGKTYIVNINATATGSSNDNTFQLGFGDSAGNPSSATQHEFAPGTSTKSLFITASATDTTIIFRSRDAGTSDLSVHSVSVKEITGVGTISGATWTHGIGAPVAQTAVIDWNKFTLDLSNEVLIPQGLTAGRDLLGNLFENVRKQGALNLDGNSWAEVHDNASLDITDAITLEAWVYFDGDSTNGKGVIGRWTSANNCYMIYIDASNRPRIYINNTSTLANAMTGEKWYHIVGTYDKTNRKIYVNGELINTNAYTSAINTSSDKVQIGAYANLAANAYNKPIAQPRIYNRALTAEEVERNFTAGKYTYNND